MKKFLAVFLCLCMLALPVRATSVQLTMDSAQVITSTQRGAPLKTEAIEAPTFTVNGRTMVPVRAIAENFGAQVGWNDPVVTITKGETVIELTIDSTVATVNGQTKTLDAAATVINGRTFVPLRFIGEAFGYTVKWVASTQRILITDSPVVAMSGSTVLTFDELYYYAVTISATLSAEEFAELAKTLCSVYAYAQITTGITSEVVENSTALISEMQTFTEQYCILPVVNESACEMLCASVGYMLDEDAYYLAIETCPAELLMDVTTLETMLADSGIALLK